MKTYCVVRKSRHASPEANGDPIILLRTSHRRDAKERYEELKLALVDLHLDWLYVVELEECGGSCQQ